MKLPSGVTFSVGTGFSDRERSAPPPVGATITFRYQELSDGGVPRFPSYVRVRVDEPTPASEPKKEVDMATPKTKVPVSGPSKPAAAAATAAPAPSGAGGKARHFEFVEGTSSKFWEISRSGNDVTTSWGRIGTAGQSKTKTFADEVAATKEYDKLVAEKTKNGYAEK